MKQQYEDDSTLTEIIIQPDGRVYVFGISKAVADALKSLEPTHNLAELPELSPEQITIMANSGDSHDQ